MGNKRWLSRSRMVRQRAAAAMALAGALVMSTGLVVLNAGAAEATVNPKVWICKYSHTPERGEQAQTVNSVNYNDNRQVGSWGFEDAQAATYVYGFSKNEDESLVKEEPDAADDCPPYNPPGDIVVDVPDEPDTNDPCGPDNIAFVVPVDTSKLHWTLLENGNVKVEPQDGYAFDQDAQYVVFELPSDSGVACTKVIEVPDRPGTDDPCGPDNIAFVVPDDTTELDWTLLENGNVKVEPQDGFEFDQDQQYVLFELPEDSNVPCERVIDIPTAPGQSDPCGAGNASWNVPQDTDVLDWSLADGVLSVSIIPKNVKFTDQTTSHSYGKANDSGVLCNETIPIPAVPGQTDPCGPANATWNVPADTSTLNWSLVDGVLSVSIIPANVTFPDKSRSHSYGTATDDGAECLGVQEVAPGVTFKDANCGHPNRASWKGKFTEVIDYSAEPAAAPGETVTVTASIKSGLEDEFAFADGVETKFTHTFTATEDLECVKGTQTSRPKPDNERPPAVLGTQAVAPTAVDAGLASLPGDTGTSSTSLLAQLMVAGGLLLLLAGGWLGLGRRESGAHRL